MNYFPDISTQYFTLALPAVIKLYCMDTLLSHSLWNSETGLHQDVDQGEENQNISAVPKVLHSTVISIIVKWKNN